MSFTCNVVILNEHGNTLEEWGLAATDKATLIECLHDLADDIERGVLSPEDETLDYNGD